MTRKSRSQPDAVRFDSLEQEVFLNLWRTYDRLRMLEDALFQQFELTPQQYNVLRLLKAALPDAVPTLTVANRLVSRAPDITRMIDKLVERGLIERLRSDENRRVVNVRLTPEGAAFIDQIAVPLADCHTRQLGHLSAKELQELGALLKLARAPHEDEESHWR
jgi:DNA-binding MarR family transcriptional regulator